MSMGSRSGPPLHQMSMLSGIYEVDNCFVLHVSLNGHDFSPAVFPPNIRVDKDRISILKSTTGALALDFANHRYCLLDRNNVEMNYFEQWSPFAGEDDRCLFGKENNYWLRKPARIRCVNDNDGALDMEQIHCKCTKKNFECNDGFFSDESGNCNRFGYDPDKLKKCEGMSESGFLKIKARECKEGMDWEDKQVERQSGEQKEVESKVTAFINRYEYGRDTVYYMYFPKSEVDSEASIAQETSMSRSLLLVSSTLLEHLSLLYTKEELRPGK
ncbi:MAG: hypothetical protein J3Q66DRAFT_362867 [Benniella sp.]|nr:MAG: hypothetical protein J3Q66DRAFT_362867 [Benniella sp.]